MCTRGGVVRGAPPTAEASPAALASAVGGAPVGGDHVMVFIEESLSSLWDCAIPVCTRVESWIVLYSSGIVLLDCLYSSRGIVLERTVEYSRGLSVLGLRGIVQTRSVLESWDCAMSSGR